MGAGANTFSLRRVVLWVVFALGTRIVLKLRLNLRDTRFYTLTGSLILSQFRLRAVYPNHLQLSHTQFALSLRLRPHYARRTLAETTAPHSPVLSGPVSLL
jgi:hypothetical protein